MKRLLSTIMGCVLTGLAASAASAPLLSRSADLHRPLDQVYAALSDYFSPDSMHDFQIVSSNRTRSKAEVVARRKVEDQVKWSELTYCKVPALELLNTLQQGNITVTVKLERESPTRTYVTVTPQFEGVYELAGNTSTRQCTSNGVLEKDILRAAGATEGDSQ